PAQMELNSMHLPNIGHIIFRSRHSLLWTLVCALMIASFASLLGVLPRPVFAQEGDIPVDQLMAGEALPDLALGSKDAPVTIVEYASMTCGHCAAFYTSTFPELKKKY